MQFQVPQFIDIEDKLVGPLTLKQFLYLAAAGGFIFILFFLLQTWLWIMFSVLIASGASALAFIKYNGRPLTKIIAYAFSYFWQPRFYIWKREEIKKEIKIPSVPEIKLPPVEKKIEAPKILKKKEEIKLPEVKVLELPEEPKIVEVSERLKEELVEELKPIEPIIEPVKEVEIAATATESVKPVEVALEEPKIIEMEAVAPVQEPLVVIEPDIRIKEVKIVKVPEVSIEEKRDSLKTLSGETPSLNKLWNKLATSKSPISRREKVAESIPAKPTQEKYEIFRKPTGERGIAKRIDYR